MLASYARFLWDADDEDEDEDEEGKAVFNQCGVKSNKNFIHMESHWPPLTAAS